MILYLSCTGNTGYAAKSLAKSLGDSAVPVSDFKPGNASLPVGREDILGICFPTHGWRAPSLMENFLREAPLPKGTDYVFLLTTCGDLCAMALDKATEILSSRGIKTDALFSLQMPNTYYGFPFMGTDSEQVEKDKLTKAPSTLSSISALIEKRFRGEWNVIYGKHPKLLSGPMGAFFRKVLVTDRKFALEKEKCLRCGKCINACPAGNMAKDSEGYPRWLHTGRCLTCFACFHICPVHAIEFDHTTKGKRQYRPRFEE